MHFRLLLQRHCCDRALADGSNPFLVHLRTSLFGYRSRLTPTWRIGVLFLPRYISFQLLTLLVYPPPAVAALLTKGQLQWDFGRLENSKPLLICQAAHIRERNSSRTYSPQAKKVLLTKRLNPRTKNRQGRVVWSIGANSTTVSDKSQQIMMKNP